MESESEYFDLYVEVERKAQSIEPEWLRNEIVEDLRSKPFAVIGGYQSYAISIKDPRGYEVCGLLSPYNTDHHATLADLILMNMENSFLKKG